ncbi:MAG: extracellular solute-binding protein [Thermomicrobiales bacterium]
MAEHQSRLTRRDALRLTGAAALGTLLPAGAASAQDASPVAGEGFFPSPMPGVPNAYYQYPVPFTTVAAPPGKGGSVSMLFLSDLRIKEKSDNQYWQELERRLGVTFDVTFIPGAAYAERMATAFAGGEFPDLMHVFTLLYPQVSEFVVQGAFTDVTAYLDGGGRAAFPNLSTFPDYAFENSKLNGVLFGVPSPTSAQPNGLWYRADWLEALGQTPPANAAEFLQMIDGMAHNDPDGNGSPDTYGNSSDTVNPFETRFVHAMFRVPAEGDGFGFTLNEDGTFTNEIETPEFRTALEYMRQMWESGAMHPDSLTHTSTDIREQFMGSSVGSISNAYILLNLMRTELAKVTPSGQVMGLVPPGHDGGEPVTYNIAGYFGQICVPASKGQDEARVEELLGISNYFAAPFGSEEYMFLNWGTEGVHHTVNDDGSRTKTQLGDEEIFNPSLGGLNVLYSPNRDEIKYIQDLMAAQTAFGVTDPTFNLYSPTAAAMKGEFQQMYFDTKIAIGAGREEMSALDDWIAEWRSRGGDQIKQELADAYEQAQG